MLHKKLLLAVGLLSFGFQPLEAIRQQKKKHRFLSKVGNAIAYPFVKTGQGIVYCAQKTKDGCEYVVEKSFAATKITAKYATVIYVTTTVGLAVYVYYNSEKVSVETMKDLIRSGLEEGETLTDEQIEKILNLSAIDRYYQTPFGTIPVTKNFVGNINAFVERSNSINGKIKDLITGATAKLQESYDKASTMVTELTGKLTESEAAREAAEAAQAAVEETAQAAQDKALMAQQGLRVASTGVQDLGNTVAEQTKELSESADKLKELCPEGHPFHAVAKAFDRKIDQVSAELGNKVKITEESIDTILVGV